jgi:homoserine/homoserine lactone efflux protein
VSLATYLAFVVATIVLVIIPGPTVTLTIANSLRHGRRAGMLNVAGTQIALALTVGIVLLGLASLIEAMGAWFFWFRFAGAAYLIWLGCKLLMASGELPTGVAPREPRGGFLLQGLAVGLSNPKTLLFFGAFFPQFIDPNRSFTEQVLIMGATAMTVAAISDTVYALAASSARMALSRRRTRLLSRASGGMLIGGGVWLALARTK